MAAAYCRLVVCILHRYLVFIIKAKYTLPESNIINTTMKITAKKYA